MMWLQGLIGVATGIISGFGIGGGSLLVLYLTVFAGVSQYTAGGINLLYFIGCAPAALIGHIRQKNMKWEVLLVVFVMKEILLYRYPLRLLRYI